MARELGNCPVCGALTRFVDGIPDRQHELSPGPQEHAGYEDYEACAWCGEWLSPAELDERREVEDLHRLVYGEED